MKIPIHSVLFQSATDSNIGVILGTNRGQYDVRLGTEAALGRFFDRVPKTAQTTMGGWTQQVPLSAFEGPNPVGATQIKFRYMGPGSARKNYDFPAQSTNAYPLWAPPRAFLTTQAKAAEGDFFIVARDIHGNFHARWIPKDDLATLPSGLQTQLSTKTSGVWMVPTNITSTAGSDELVREVVDALRTYTNVLLYGPPATGKTYLINEVRRAFHSSPVVIDTASERQAIRQPAASSLRDIWVTFHQSYSYEDFLVGLRPRPAAPGQGFSLVPKPGALLELTEWARRSGNQSLLVIDEINRGNVSRIFGEFITLLEPDKRLNEDGTSGETTLSIRLPYSDLDEPIHVELAPTDVVEVPHPFTMPASVYTLATMNSVDKSVAPLDAALRRRFHIISLAPDFSVLSSANAPVALAIGVKLLTYVNSAIAKYLGPDFEFGHWFLGPLCSAPDELAGQVALLACWRNHILPQLEEHFAGRTDQLISILKPTIVGAPIEVVAPSNEEEGLGASSYFRNRSVTDDELIEYFSKLAEQ